MALLGGLAQAIAPAPESSPPASMPEPSDEVCSWGGPPLHGRGTFDRSEGFARAGYFIPGQDGTRTWQISGVVRVTARAFLLLY